MYFDHISKVLLSFFFSFFAVRLNQCQDPSENLYEQPQNVTREPVTSAAPNGVLLFIILNFYRSVVNERCGFFKVTILTRVRRTKTTVMKMKTMLSMTMTSRRLVEKSWRRSNCPGTNFTLSFSLGQCPFFPKGFIKLYSSCY